MTENSGKQLYKLVYDATIRRLDNFEALGMHEPVASSLLSLTAALVAEYQSGALSEKSLDEYVGACQVAVATGILADSDVEKISDLLEAMEKEL
jgi:hypothetical protein